MEIGAVIKEYRMLKAMTQEELARALAVTPQAVSRWENGISYPDIAMVPEIVKVLGVSADKLLGCGRTEAKRSGEQNGNVENLEGKNLNQDQIDSIFGYTSLIRRPSKSVLVVDDSDYMRMMLSKILSQDHHSVLQAKNGEDCLEILRNDAMLHNVKIKVCILDIMMPGMNGLEVLERIKEICPGLRVIMLSAQCTEATVRRALELGADSFVAKPFQAESLLERI